MAAANALYGVILNHLRGKKGLSARYVKFRNALLEEVGADRLPPCVRGRTRLGACSEYFKKKATGVAKQYDLLREEFASLRNGSGTPRTTTSRRRATAPRKDGLAIFISHSSKDAALAGALIELLVAALRLDPPAIRCTSVPPYELAAGEPTDAVIRREVTEARVFIALITPQSIASVYVLFELGARWGIEPSLVQSGRRSGLIPLLAGLDNARVPRPLSNLNLPDVAKRPAVLALVKQVADTLGSKLMNITEYNTHVDRVLKAANS